MDLSYFLGLNLGTNMADAVMTGGKPGGDRPSRDRRMRASIVFPTGTTARAIEKFKTQNNLDHICFLGNGVQHTLTDGTNTFTLPTDPHGIELVAHGDRLFPMVF